MKRFIPTFIISALFLYIMVTGFSQDLDLIINTAGDSIACSIDSISSDRIHFEMRFNSKWIRTSISKDLVSEYQYDVIDKKAFIYKPGTSIIESPNADSLLTRNTIKAIPRNMICMEYGLGFWVDMYYERLIPLNNYMGLTLRGGPSFGAGFVGGVSVHGGAGLMIGKNRHYGYLAAGLRHEFIEEENRDTPYTQPYLEAFYRFVGYNGLILKIGVETIVLSIGVGYAF